VNVRVCGRARVCVMRPVGESAFLDALAAAKDAAIDFLWLVSRNSSLSIIPWPLA